MKKITVVLFALSLVLIMSACGGTGEKTDPTPTPVITAEPTAVPTPTAEPTPAPTRVPDPEVDAVIFNFFYENDHGYDTIGMTNQCDVEWVSGKGLGVFPVSEDPWIQIEPIGPNDEEVNLIDYPIFKIRIWNQTPGVTFEAFTRRAGAAISGDDLFQKGIAANGTEFIDLIIDLKELKGEAFVKENNGTVSEIRLDLINLTPPKATVEEHAGDGSIVIYVDYFGFFKTVEDAQSWVPTHLTQG